MSLYKRLFRNLKPYLGRLYLAIFFSIIVGIIATSPVPIIQKTFDKIFVDVDKIHHMSQKNQSPIPFYTKGTKPN